MTLLLSNGPCLFPQPSLAFDLVTRRDPVAQQWSVSVSGLAGFIYVSSFLSMVIAVERCFCVISPFRSQGILHSRTMAIIIVIATVVIVGGHFIVAAQWRVVCIFDPISGTSLDAVFNSHFYFSNTGSPSSARFTSSIQVVDQQPGLLQ